MTIPHTMTNESITVIVQGRSYTVPKGAPNFNLLKKALKDKNWTDVPNHLTAGKSLESWAQGRFKVDGNVLAYDGKALPASLNERVSDMARRGEDPSTMFKFWERLQRNPSYRSVNQLWDFLQHQGIPLTPEGCFLAYKSVGKDYKDHHSGKFDNSPGQTLSMPRNEISDDPDVPCHEGFHVGAYEYASAFGNSESKIVICKVQPEDVVCVPKDHSFQKMRVSRYEVVGNYGVNLPSTSFDDTNNGSGKEDKPVRVSSTTKKKPTRAFAKLNAMDMRGLMEQTIDTLRRYAYEGLNIIGASKIAGGKLALVNAILKVRD